MSKQVLIDYNLFLELVKFHCVEMQDDPIRNKYIYEELSKKLDKMVEHKKYSEKLNNTP